jgi:hypothetical protein
MPLHLTPAPTALYRVGRLPEPFIWRFPVENLLDSDNGPELGGGRWDAPASEFETLYCADSPVVAFAETIAAYRPVGGLEAKIAAATDEEEPDSEFDFPAHTGELPDTYFEPQQPSPHGRALGKAVVIGDPMLVDVGHPDTHHELNSALGALLRRFHVDGFDRGVMMSQDRRITRPVAAYLHGIATGAVGIQYESRYLDGFCFVLWQRAPVHPGDVNPVTKHTRDLRRAAELLHIRIPP